MNALARWSRWLRAVSLILTEGSPIPIITATTIDTGNPNSLTIIIPVITIPIVMAVVAVWVVTPVVIISGSRHWYNTGSTEKCRKES
jgi:hypothetical protein